MSIMFSKARWALPLSFAPDPPRAPQAWAHFLDLRPLPAASRSIDHVLQIRLGQTKCVPVIQDTLVG